MSSPPVASVMRRAVSSEEIESFVRDGIVCLLTEDLPKVPDIDAARDDYDVVHFELEPGDCTVHHGLLVHGAALDSELWPVVWSTPGE